MLFFRDVVCGMLYARLPLVCLFAGGYLVYRLVAVHDLTGHIVPRLFGRAAGKRDRPGRTLWVLLLAPALLSLFLPNAISVLALLPLARSVRDGGAISPASSESAASAFSLSPPQSRNAATLACLCIIWGANIGGMGSLIGSPANLLLLAALDVFQLPQSDRITFGNWFVWSLPLVAMLLCIAWLCARYVAVPLCSVKNIGSLASLRRPSCSPAQRRAFAAVGAFLVFWCLDSLAVALHFLPSLARVAVSVGFTAGFVGLCFVSFSGFRLLRPRDCISGLPVRGLFFLAVVLALMAVVQISGLADATARTLQARAVGLPPYVLILALCLCVMFLTEAFSNTIVATAFFGLAAALGATFPGGPLPLMLAVSCASTCAFMTPIATPANALAFGEMRGARLPVLLVSGLLLNILAAVAISIWLPLVVPLVYGG